jgi:hypothetical protein
MPRDRELWIVEDSAKASKGLLKGKMPTGKTLDFYRVKSICFLFLFILNVKHKTVLVWFYKSLSDFDRLNIILNSFIKQFVCFRPVNDLRRSFNSVEDRK